MNGDRLARDNSQNITSSTLVYEFQCCSESETSSCAFAKNYDWSLFGTQAFCIFNAPFSTYNEAKELAYDSDIREAG